MSKIWIGNNMRVRKLWQKFLFLAELTLLKDTFRKKLCHPHVVPNLYKLLSSMKNKITKVVVTLSLKVLKVLSFRKDAEAPHKYCKSHYSLIIFQTSELVTITARSLSQCELKNQIWFMNNLWAGFHCITTLNSVCFSHKLNQPRRSCLCSSEITHHVFLQNSGLEQHECV